MITVSKTTSPVSDVGILLGRQGENEARQIVFDLSWLIETYGNGTATLVHQRSKDTAPYICTTTQDGSSLTWMLNNLDTAYDGWGQAELRWTVSDVLAKTLVYKTMVVRSITADSTIPDPYESWYDQMIEYIDEHGIDPEDLAAAIAAYLEEHPVEAPVQSVNNKTGAVVLSASDVGAGTYSKPSGGIPKTDLASGVQSSLDKADSALQSYTETDPTVPSWAKQQNKPTYTAQEVGALPSDTTIPTKVSQLQNDSGFGTYSKPSGGIPKTDLASGVQASLDKADSALQTAPVTSVNNKTGAVTLSASDVGAGTYSKPSGGIPSSDMTSSVQTSLGKADSAYQKPSGGIPSTDMSSAVQTSLGKADTALQTAPVSSVNTKTGAVTLAAGDIGYDDSATYDSGTVGKELTELKGGLTEKYTKPSGGIPSTDMTSEVQTSLGKADSAYQKPSGGIPSTDLASGVIPSVPVTDVQVNGSSILNNGVANVPLANETNAGVVIVRNGTDGLKIDSSDRLSIAAASGTNIKSASNNFRPITSYVQDQSVFYGLAKAAGDSSQASSSNSVGTYTESAKSAISDMLNGSVSVSGSTPSITAKSGIRYVCGECSTLSITAPASGCVDVVFESGSTATVLTVTSAKTGVSAIKWANGFDPTSLEANTVYELNILDGEYGVSCSWT